MKLQRALKFKQGLKTIAIVEGVDIHSPGMIDKLKGSGYVMEGCLIKALKVLKENNEI